jgi:cytoskeletal protein CcmA (bactofilin family)
MFNSSKKDQSIQPVNSNNLLGRATNITGDIKCDGDIRIDGVLLGNLIVSGKLIVGEYAEITGDIKANYSEVFGKIKGKIIVDELLSIRSNGYVEGDIFAGNLQIEASAKFNGVCHMSQPVNVVDLKKDDKKLDGIAKAQ